MLDYSKNAVCIPRVRALVRDYQGASIAQAVHYKKCLFDMYPGMGKTLCVMTATFLLKPRRILILCGRSALGSWTGGIKEWFPEYADPAEFQIIKAQGITPLKRRALWNDPNKTYYIATLQTYILDYEHIHLHFDEVIIDEVHKVPKHTTKTFISLEKAIRDVPIKFFLTGTWIDRDASRGWKQLHLLDRKVFPSYWKFVNLFCEMMDTGFGQQISGPKNRELFRDTISKHVFRYHKTTGNIPQSARKKTWVNMDAEQSKIYNDLATQMFSMLENGTMLLSSVSLTTFTKLRQLLNCPKILDPSLGFGAAFNTFLEHLEDHEDDPAEMHGCLFSPFKDSLPYFQRELQRRGFKTWMFIGGTDGQEVARRSMEFRAAQGKKSFTLGTIDFAESFHLGTSTRSHFFGTPWTNRGIIQAEARLARADSDLSKIILHRYWLYNNTRDEEQIDVIEQRARHVRTLFSSIDELRAAMFGQK